MQQSITQFFKQLSSEEKLIQEKLKFQQLKVEEEFQQDSKDSSLISPILQNKQMKNEKQQKIDLNSIKTYKEIELQKQIENVNKQKTTSRTKKLKEKKQQELEQQKIQIEQDKQKLLSKKINKKKRIKQETGKITNKGKKRKNNISASNNNNNDNKIEQNDKNQDEDKQNDEEGEEEYEVDKIIDHYFDQQNKQYLYEIKWVNYSLDQTTWEPEDCLQGSKQLIRGYWMKVQEPVYEDSDNWGEELIMDGIVSYMFYKKTKYYLIKWNQLMEEANSWITEKYAIKKDILMVKDFEEKVKRNKLPESFSFQRHITTRGTFVRHIPQCVKDMRFCDEKQEYEYLFIFNPIKGLPIPDPNWAFMDEIPRKYQNLVTQFKKQYEKEKELRKMPGFKYQVTIQYSPFGKENNNLIQLKNSNENNNIIDDNNNQSDSSDFEIRDY